MFSKRKKRKPFDSKNSKVTVLAVDSTRGIPKGKYRKELKANGFEKTIEVKRNFSSQEIKNEIIRAFGFTRRNSPCIKY